MAVSVESTTTILFTDLVSSTQLLQRSGDEAARRIFREHRRLLQQAVATHGGSEIKWLGDGLMVAFPSAANAVRCAIAMQRAARKGIAGERIAIRIGLNVGDALRDQADYFGTPVVVARRLCDAAQGDQILCSSVVHELLLGRKSFRFRDLGTAALKGLSSPVRLFEILHDAGAEAAPPAMAPAAPVPPPALPGALTYAEQFPFAGRDRELERLVATWGQTVSEGQRVVLVGGEPGIGKSRLVAEAGRVVHAQGGLVLVGRCDENLGVPFQPFFEALDYFVLQTSPRALQERLGRYSGELIRMVPDLVRRIPNLPAPIESDPQTERYRLFEAVASWLSAASTHQPLLLILEDLHWAGKPTLYLLGHVIRATSAARLMILATYRDTDADRGPALAELLADVRPVSHVERLTMCGLDEDGVFELLERAAGRLLERNDRRFARAVFAETAGNPLFVTEVLRHLVETGAIVQRDGCWVAGAEVAELALPAGVRDVVLRRVQRLSPGAQEALTLAAVIGRDFNVDVLSAVSSLREDALLAALDEAVAAQLVRETGVNTYRFSHALVRSALYSTVGASRRVRLHCQIAEAIERKRPTDVTALAHHFGESGEEFIHKALEYAERAGDQSLARLAHHEAAHFYHRALGLLETANASDLQRRCALLVRLGMAQRAAGEARHRATLLAAAHLAQQLGNTELLVRAALANNRGWESRTGAVDAERVAVLEAALGALDERDGAPRAMLLATLAAELTYAGDRRRRVALSDAALAMARRVGDPATLAHVLKVRSHTIWEPATSAERLANTAEHMAIVAQLDDPLARWYASATRPQTCMEAGDIVEVDRHLEILWQLTQELGQPHLRWAATINRAWRALLAGRLAEAEKLATEAYQAGDASGEGDALAYYAAQLLAIRFDQGRLGELIPVLEQAVAENPGIPGFKACLALAYNEDGRREQAAPILEEERASRFECVPLDIGWLSTLALYAEVAAGLKAREAATLLYGLLAPWEGQVVFNGLFVFGAVTRSLGLLAAICGRAADADRHFAAAATLHERIGAPVLLARTRLDWAGMLLAQGAAGDHERARLLTRDALATARALDLVGLERRALALLG